MSSRHERVAFGISTVILLLSLLNIGTDQLRNGDTFWHVRTGELALETGTFPTVDTFSYTVRGTPWNNHEWGFQLVVALLVKAFGWGSLRVMVFVLCAGTLLGIWLVLRQRVGPLVALGVAASTQLFITHKFIVAPQTVSMALFLFSYWFMRRAKPGEPWSATLGLSALMLVWGNFTAEVVVFLPFIVIELGSRIWEHRRSATSPQLLHRCAALLLPCLAPLVNPPWSSTIEYAVVGTSVNRDVNNEFRTLFEAAATVTPFTKVIAALVIVVSLVWSINTFRTEPTARRFRRSAPLFVAAIGALLMERNLWMLTLPLARIACELKWKPVFQSIYALAASVCLVVWLVLSGWRPSNQNRVFVAEYWTQHIDTKRVPVNCVDYVADNLGPGRRIYLPRIWASYSIWKAREDFVFIDGRNREYPLEMHNAGKRIHSGSEGTLSLLSDSGTDVVIEQPAWNQLPGVQNGPWRPVFRGPMCAVFVAH